MDMLQKIDPIGASVTVIVVVISIYLSYMYFTKDNKSDDLDYTSLAYSIVISILLGVLTWYGYQKFKPRNCELLREEFYS